MIEGEGYRSVSCQTLLTPSSTAPSPSGCRRHGRRPPGPRRRNLEATPDGDPFWLTPRGLGRRCRQCRDSGCGGRQARRARPRRCRLPCRGLRLGQRRHPHRDGRSDWDDPSSLADHHVGHVKPDCWRDFGGRFPRRWVTLMVPAGAVRRKGFRWVVSASRGARLAWFNPIPERKTQRFSRCLVRGAMRPQGRWHTSGPMRVRDDARVRCPERLPPDSRPFSRAQRGGARRAAPPRCRVASAGRCAATGPRSSPSIG